MPQVRKFTIVLEPEEEGGFTVRVPSLPEIVTYGKDKAEAMAMAEDAVRLVLEDGAARGEPILDGGWPRIRVDPILRDCHCEERIARRSNLDGTGDAGPRLLRFARNDNHATCSDLNGICSGEVTITLEA